MIASKLTYLNLLNSLLIPFTKVKTQINKKKDSFTTLQYVLVQPLSFATREQQTSAVNGDSY